MKHTKKFLARVLTVVLVVMTLFSTMSVAFTATAAQMPESYTQEFDLGGDSTEAPKGDAHVETPEKKPEEPEDSASATAGASILNVLGRAGKDIANVGANVDLAGTGWTCGSGTIYFDAGSWSVSTLYFMIGHDTYSECYKMSKDTGTIYKVSLPSGWDGATEWCIINAGSGWGSENNSPSHRKGYATNASSVRSSAPSSGTCYTSSGTKTFKITVSAGTGGTVSGGGSSLKFRSTTTIKATANTGYSFSKWSDGNTSASRTITVTGDASYTASFTKNSYTITVKAGTGGTVSGGGTYEYNSSVTIKATANTGYNFVSWDDGNTSASRTITVTGNKTYTASFAKKTYTVKWLDGDGSTLETDTVEHGGSATCSKTPTKASTAQYSYTHSGWDTSASNVTSNLTIKPTFTSTVRSYKITVNAGTGGSASGGGTYKYGTEVTLKATPDTGYNFSGWSGGSTSTNSSITITVSGAKTYTANFTIKSYTVTFKDDSAVGGDTLKTQTVNHGSAATAPSVSPSGGWEFYSWDKDFSNITGNTTVTAIRSNKNVQLLGDGNIGGWSTGTSRRMTYHSDGTSTKTVTLPAGKYELKIYTEEWGEWLGNSGTVSDSCSGWDMGSGNNLTLNASGGKYTFTFNRNTKKLSISFSAIKYTVTPKAGTGGSASADYTSVNLGGTTTLTAKPSKGYHFTGWSIGSNGTIVSGSTSSTSVTIQVSGDVTCTASFAGNAGTVKFATGDNGSVSNSGSHSVTYPNDSSSKATPATGYSFSKWTVSGGTEGTDWDFTSGSTTSASIGIKVYTAGKTITATASFTANKRTINFAAGSGGTVSSAGGAVTYPSTTSSTAKPNTGYHFTSWSVSGGTAGTDYKITSGSTSSASITVQPLKTGTTTFTANFEINSYTVKFVDHDGTVLKTQTVTHGSGATAPANPSRTGYTFSKWDKAYSNITADTTITAVYTINTYDVTLTKSPSAGGTVSANDYTIDYNKTCTITATPNEGYSFVKWEITSGTGKLASATSASTTLTVTSDITVKATFDIAVYTVNFRDHADFGGEIVNTQYIEHGSNATAPAGSLIKPEGGWEFYSWGDASAYQNVKKDLNIYAVRSNKNVQLLGDGNIGGWSTGTGMRMTYNSNGTSTKTVKLPKGTYELKIYTEEWGEWKGNNGTVVDTTDTTASAGWDMDGGNNLKLQASGGNYTFTYYRNTNKLKITYSPITYKVSTEVSPSAGGTTTISQTSVHYGDTTTLKATAKAGYTFSKWTFTGSPKITDGSATSATVTIMPSQATTATAVFTANTATVKYASSTGGTVTNMGDNSVTYPDQVKSTATPNSGYTFSNWNVTGGTKGTDWDFATGDANSATIGIKVYKKGATITATAIFTANAAVVNFTATEGGSVTNAGNNTVTYPNTIKSTATAAVSHNFTGWTITGGTLNTDYKITAGSTSDTSITIQPITGKKITATANFTIKKYTVTFVNWDGSKLAAYSINHGSNATYSGSTPTRPSTAQYSYTFKGWDKTFTNITADLTVTAQYTEAIRSYTVKFVDHDGDVLKTQTVEYGKGATAPSNPSRSDGWIFDKWDKAYNNITGDTTVTALYWDNNVYLAGSFTAWEANSSNKMSYGTTSSITFNLNEGNYEFKFIYKGYWQGNNGEVVNTTDNNGSSNPWETYDGNNIRLKAIGGKYTFTFNKETYRFEVKHVPISYTVKFVSDGKTLSTQTVLRGEDAKAPANPTKAADAQYTYTFEKWDKSYTGVRSDLTINAVFTKTTNKYVVTFKDHDGTILNTQNVEYGKGATAPANPVRAGYTFAGWDKDFSNITGALTVTAKYTVNTYTVKFVNWNGTEIKTEQVEYGKAATAPANPTRPADAQYTYTFKAWDKAFNKITEDTTVTATYTQTVNSYTVQFVNWDGKVYKTQTVEYGKAATAPSNPSRNDGWTFIGWDKDFSNITGDLTVTAQWTDNNVYLQGTLTTWTEKASSTKMSYGNTSVMSLELAAGTYEFKLIYGSNESGNVWYGNGGEINDTTETTSPGLGWEMTTSAGNCKLIATGGTYTFRFNKSTKFLIVEYFSNAKNVTFKDHDGTILATAKVEEGKTAASVAPADPTRNADAQYTYTFAGWTPSINTAITKDTVFTATYTQTKNKYTVTFVNWDGTELGKSTVEYGTAATAPAQTPTRPADAQYTYTFSGWDKDITNVTANITATAKYSTTVNKYNVFFKYMTADGKTEKTDIKSVAYGSEADAPTVPTRTDGWTFIGWDKDFHYITGELTVTAKYRNDNIYLVLGPKSSDSGWNTYTMSQSGDTATYKVALVPGTYQFKLNQDTVWYGNWGTFDDTTDTTSASGWDMNADAGNCTLNASGGTYTFTFNNATKKLIVKYVPTTYTVKFFDWDGTQIGSTQTIAIGKPATAPADPTRESTVSHDYTFSGWSENFSSVTKDMEIYAQYKETLRKYTVVFSYIDADGKTVKTESQQVEYGTAATAPKLPLRADGQALRKWDKDFSNITGDITVTAEYFDDNAYIKGNFNNWDNTGVLQTYGNKTVSKRIELAAGTYEFKFFHDGMYYTDTNAGTVEDTTGEYWWNTTDNGNVGNTKLSAKGGWYTFTFNTETKAFKIAYEPYMYTVTFKDYDGKVLDTQEVAISTAAKAPATPTRNDGWVFENWDTDFSNVKSDLTVTAVYYDNNIYLMGINGDWTTTNANNRLTNKGTNNVVELTLEIGKTSGDTFTQSQHEFKFKQHNTWYTYKPTSGSSRVITDSTMGNWYNTISGDVGNTTLKASGGTYTFKFATDTKDFNIHYEAIKYEVIFYDYAQNVLKKEMVSIGQGATAPDVPTRSNGFKFLKWDKDFSCITDRTEVYARYYDDKMYLSGDFNNWGTTALGTYGDKIQSATMVLEPGSYSFNFFHNEPVNGEAIRHYHTDINNGTFENETISDNDGWWDTKKADGGQTTLISTGGIYTFYYNTETNQFKVTYVPNVFDVTFIYYDVDGKTLIEETQEVKLGENAIAPEVPVRKDGWVFDKWDKEFTNIQGDLTVTAKYIDGNVYFTAMFNNWNEKATPLQLTENENIVKIKLEFAPGEHEFKLHKGDGWYSYDGTITDETTSAVAMSTSVQANARLKATGGYYTFTYNKANDTLEVSYEPYMYTVTFVDYDDKVLKTEEVAITKAATAPATPTRNDGFIFTGWDKNFDYIQSDLTVKAQYKDDNVYLMGIDKGWTKEDCNIMKSSDGNTATYTIRNVSGAATYEFKFLYEDVWYTDINAGTVDNKTEGFWSTTNDQSVGNTKLNASGGSYVITFNKTDKTFQIEHKPNIYHVTFNYYGKTYLEPITTTVAVEAGGTVELPKLETRTDEWFYLFWAENKDGKPYGTRYIMPITNVTQDMVIQAWYFDDNAYLIGDPVDGVWSRTLDNIMEDYNFEAGTSKKVIHLDPGRYEFKVIHRHDDGMNDYMYGNNGTVYDTCYNWETSTAYNNFVLNASGGTYTFTFDRLTKRLSIEYDPDFFEVTFVDYDGTILDTQTIQSSHAATAPKHADRTGEGFKFSGWDKDFSRVVSDMTVTAQYYDDKVYIVGDFNDWVTNQAMGPYGSNPVSAGFHLEPGTYNFKLLHNGSWYGNNGTIYDSAEGWTMSTSEGNCTLVATGGYYTFQYDPETNKLTVLYDQSAFTVKFFDWNGTLLDTQIVERGKAAVPPTGLTREGDVQYTYEFSGWDKDYTNIQSDVDITAQYTQITNKYDVTFVDHNNAVIAVVPTEYGTAAVAPEVPARNDGWVFSHWDKDFSNITGELTVQAQYINGNVYLAGTFNDWNETSLPMKPTGNANEFSTTIILHHGLEHEFKIKVGDGWFGNSGTFTDTTDVDGNPNPWQMSQTSDMNGSNTHINTTGGYYTFIYNIVTQKMEVKYEPFVYTVNFYDYNDVLLKTEQVEITKSATAPKEPTRGGGFIFKGWSTDFSRVMSNLDVYAQYFDDNLYLKGTFNEWGTENMFTKYGDKIVTTTVELEPGTYTFKIFKETENGGELWFSAPSETIVDSTDWKASDYASSLGDTILIANGGYYTFTFNHENNNFKIDYKPYQYEVTFVYKDADGKTDIRTTQTVDRGQAATAPTLPFRPDGFEFNGWDKDFTYITEDITVTASYFDNNIYVVGDFNNWTPSDAYKLNTYGNAEVSARIELAPGDYEFKFYRNGIYYTDFESATFVDKTDSAQATKTDGGNTKLDATGGWYTFTFNNNSEQFTIAYEPYVYTVNFIDHDGTVLKSEKVEISKDATAPADPTREHYNFTGWDKSFTNVQSNLDVHATYAIHTFEVTFLYYAADGKTQLSAKQTVDYGAAAKAPTLPKRADGWVFSYWDKDFSFISENITVEAHYIDDNVYLVGDFNNWNETATRMELTENENVVKIKITLDEGEYDFKLKRGDGWYSNTGDINNTTDINGTSNPWDMDATVAPNCTLITAGGNYTFIYNKETQKLEVKYSPYTFVVTFVDWDGTVLKTQTVDIGTDASAPHNPTRPDEGNIVYTFKGWDKSFSNVKEDLTVTALYEETSRLLTVTFVDWDGKVLKTEKVEKGQDATPPATPVREGNAEFKYTFAGWDPGFKNVQTDLTVTATYIQEVQKYTVNFVDYDDKILKTEEVEYGKSATAPADPSRGDNYIFTGWQGDFSKITEATTIKATYGDNKVYLKGDFNNWGNTTVMQKTGENEYTVRIELEEGSYDFKINRFETWYGNNGEFTDTTDENGVSNPWFMPTDAGDCTINATGGEYIFIFNTQTQTLEVKHILEKFTVVFQDADGTMLKTEEVEYGKSATAPAAPTAPAGFKFVGWDTEFTFITADTIVTAVYAEIGAQFEVIFVDWNGTVLSTQIVEAGEAAIAPADPTRVGDAQFSYNFTGWDKDFSKVSENMTITATYEQVVNKYNVTFMNGDRTHSVKIVEYGNKLTDYPVDPVKDNAYFVGWVDANGEMFDLYNTVITGEITLYAKFADNNQLFTVKFWNYDGSKLLKEETVTAGSPATAPEGPARAETAEFKFVFTGWDKNFSAVMSDLDVYPVYNEIKQIYKVTFKDYNGAVLDIAYVEYGNPAFTTVIPYRAADNGYSYEFKGWSPNPSYVTGNMTVTAQYTSSVVRYNVYWIVKGEVIKTGTIAYGTNATPPTNVGAYLAAGETLQGWHTGNGQIVNNYRIEGDTTFIASILNTTVYIGGDFTSWGWVPMTQSATNGNVYTYTINLAQGVYEFKNLYQDVFYGNDGEIFDSTGGWWSASGSAGNVTLNATGGQYTFEFNKQTKQLQVKYGAPKYTVTFQDWDGTVLKTQDVERGKPATAPANPYRETENGITYTFTGWDKDFSYITENTVVTAKYAQSTSSFTVTFVDWNGNVLKTEQVEYGGAATAPANPSRPNYQFIGWSREFTNVTSSITVEAQYEGNLYYINVNASQGGTASTNKSSVRYDDVVTLTAKATGENNFKRWTISGSFEIVSGSTTSSTITIRPTSDINATATFGEGVNLTVHSYSVSGYEYLFIKESDGTNTNYPAGNAPGTKQPATTNFHGVNWKTSNELEMTRGYYDSVIANLTNGNNGVPAGTGNLVVFENTLNWSSVHLYTAAGNIWNGDNGCTTKGATHYTMTRIGSTNYWYAYVSNTGSILFMKDEQNDYDNIWNTAAAFRTDYNSSYPTFTPSTTSSQSTNGTTYYSNGNWSGTPSLSLQSADFTLQNVLYKNGTWAGVEEVWLYDGGGNNVRVTVRRDLLDLIDVMTHTYNNGVNPDNMYTEDSWDMFVEAYEYAKEIVGSSTSTQDDIDEAEIFLQDAYDALELQAFHLVKVTQTGMPGTVVVNSTTITTASGTAQVSHNGKADISVSAPNNYYISGIIANGDVLFTNTNQSITAKALTLTSIVEDVELEVQFERKLSYTITVHPYDQNAGTLYYGDTVLNAEGDAITVFAGENATITAVAKDGYAIRRWVIDETGEFYKSSYTFASVKENHEIAIEWQQVKEVTLTAQVNPVGAGTASATSGNNNITTEGSSSMKLNQYDTVTLTAKATDPRYIFDSWNIEGEYSPADNSTRFDKTFNIVITGDVTATANYIEAYRKIYLDNEANWNECYIYYWGSQLETDQWPGTKMEIDPVSGYYVGYVPYDITNLQFNNGSNQAQVEFSDVTPNLYSNGNKKPTTYVEPGYYLQGAWNGINHTTYDLEKFTENPDGTYSITISVTSTGDGYIYVNPTNELSHFWNAETANKTDNPQVLIPTGEILSTPNQVKVEIDTNDLEANYDVKFTFDPDGKVGEENGFWWEVLSKETTINVIATDGRGTNSADNTMVTNNDRVGKTYFDTDTVVKVNGYQTHQIAAVIPETAVTFSTQVNRNGFGTYDYYVYGWVINGTEFVFASNMGNGLYSGSYIFTQDNSTVVPVYYHTEEWLAANGVEQVTVYSVIDKNIENWDKYISVYTWYNNGQNVTEYEQYGQYPGQLMVPIAGLDGVYYTFVELTSPAGLNVSGIVFGNYAPNVNDSSNMDTIVVDYTTIQTYDYYDFIALLEDGNENITFVVKNTNDKYNADRLNGTSVTLKDYNFVQYTDYSGLKTDIFGTNIESINDKLTDDNALYIIQAGNKSVHEGVLNGDYYVQCFIYDASGKLLGSCYSYELHDKDSALWTGILAPYKNQRAYFSYEAMNSNRYDGEWYGDSDLNVDINVSVNVGLKVEENITINETEPVNKATYGEAYVNATEQNIDIFRGTNFTLTAVPKAGYRFVGWYSQNGMLFSTNISYVATSAVGATYTAVFEELDKESFYVNHYIYTGVGTTSSLIPKAHGGNAELYVGIKNVTMGAEVALTRTESAAIQARVGDKLIITIATDALGADKFFAWYVQAKDKYGLTSFEEVGVDSYDNIYDNKGTVIGRNDMVYFQFEYTVKADVHSMTLYSDLMPVSAEVTLEYNYNDRNGKVKTYYVPYTLSYEEIEGFAGNNFTPYTPAYISGDGWINTILANAPHVEDLKKDTTWVINKAMYDDTTFVLWATQPDTLYTITSQVGDQVIVVQKVFGELCTFDIRDILGEEYDISLKGFWYNDINNNGKYDQGIDIILTYGPHYGYRVTADMNINYIEVDKYDFQIFTDPAVYGREQTSNEDGSNKVDRVNVSFVNNILTPYFYNGTTFVPSKEPGRDEEMGAHVTIKTLREKGYTVNFGTILEQVGSFEPGTDKYPTFEDALKAAQNKNYGVATDHDILLNEVLDGYKKPVMTSTGTYCTVYDLSGFDTSNKNRYMFTLSLSNTMANQKRFYNVYSYVTITTPDGVTTTYIGNVQTLNFYTIGTSQVEN